MVIGQGLFTQSTTAQHVLGEKITTPDGRSYRYVKAGASDLVPGKLYQASAEDTNDQNLTAVAASAGATSISASTTITATANEYAGGYAIITVTPGEGYIYRIASHAAFTAAAPTFQLEDPIQVALTTASRIDLVRNPYNGVVVNPTTATSAPVGVAVYPIAAGKFGWLQTGGPAALLADGAITVGTNVIASNAVAGAVEAGADAADLQAFVGVAMTGIATTEYGAVMLALN